MKAINILDQHQGVISENTLRKEKPNNRLLYIFCLGLMWLFLGACKPSKTAKEQLKGVWVGAAMTKPYPDLVHFRYDSAAWLRLFYNRVDMHKLSDLKFEDNTLTFPVDFPPFSAKFEGEVKENLISGSFDIKGAPAAVNLIKIAPEDIGKVGKMAGFYEFGPGHLLELSPFFIDMSLTPISLTDFQSGSRRIAFPVGNGKFSAGPQMLNPYPEEISFSLPQGIDTLECDLVLNDPQLGILKGKRLADLGNHEDLTIQHKDLTLAATITYPNTTAEKYPLVIFVPGAGERTRENAYKDYIKLLPYYGVATLAYDKRGCGESGGNLRNSSFNDLADDLAALVKQVGKHPKIDPNNIGLLGVGQATYVMPIAANQLNDLRFMVMISAATHSLETQEYQATARRMKADGMIPAHVKEALAYQKKMFAYLRGETDSLLLQQAADKLKDKVWADYVTDFNRKEYIGWWRKHHDFDPKPYLQNVKVPMLAFYGTQDVLLDVDKHEKTLRQIMAKQPADSVSKIVVYPQANHFLIMGENRGDFQFSEIIGYAPGMFNTLNEWIVKRFGLMH